MARRSDAELLAAYEKKVEELKARNKAKEQTRHARLTAEIQKLEAKVQNLQAKKHKDNEAIDRRIKKAESDLAEAIAQLEELVQSDAGQAAG